MNKNPVICGCMRFGGFSKDEMNVFVHKAMEAGINYFDHADIYADGASERVFGEAVSGDSSIKRENLVIQSKCGIRKGFYDFSKEYILQSVDGILSRLKTDYLDYLLLHRPDALCEPEEVAEAFELLEKSGKVRAFGVSNHNPMQIELLKKYVKQPFVVNQLQFSLPVSNIVAQGLEVNMLTEGSLNRDGSILDYCRLKDITIQAWSPFQKPFWKGTFIEDGEYYNLNNKLKELAWNHKATPTQIAAAWILRHPANMQLVSGTTSIERLKEICEASKISLNREEWYALYLAAGHILP